MREVLAATLFLLSSPALAQELPAGATDWSGFYAGVGIVVSQTSIEPGDTGDGGGSLSLVPGEGNIVFEVLTDSTSGGVGGQAMAGYGIQVGSAFLAVEGGLDLAGAVSAETMTVYTGSAPSCDGYIACNDTDKSMNIDRLGQVRGLIGVVLDPKLMGFASAGVVLANATAEVAARAISLPTTLESSASTSELIAGITVGVGVEYRVTDNLRLRTEADLDSFSWSYDVETEVTANDASGIANAVSEMQGNAVFADVSGRISLIWQF